VGVQSLGSRSRTVSPGGLLDGPSQAAYLLQQSNYESPYWVSFQQVKRTAMAGGRGPAERRMSRK